MSSALWWVLNGRAVAPPGITCIIGVSTSRKPRASRNPRIPFTIAPPASKTRRGPPLWARSGWRWRVVGGRLDVGQAVPLLGQRPHGLREEGQVVHLERQLPRAGAHQRAG